MQRVICIISFPPLDKIANTWDLKEEKVMLAQGFREVSPCMVSWLQWTECMRKALQSMVLEQRKRRQECGQG